MQNNWGNFSKIAFFAICGFFAVQRGRDGPSGPTVNTPLAVCSVSYDVSLFHDGYGTELSISENGNGKSAAVKCPAWNFSGKTGRAGRKNQRANNLGQ